MTSNTVHTIDLNFLGYPNGIASYLISFSNSAVLIEPGPGSTLPNLLDALKQHDLSPQQVTDIFITHIHLDHAGAVGWFAQQGSIIHVHPNGASHLINPEKLLNSAKRIYGDQMDPLWGEFLPVPEQNLHIPQDQEVLTINGESFQIFDTPGHSEHHYCILYNGILFSGDIGGIRIPYASHLELPTPPPEFHPKKWRKSIELLKELKPLAIAPTHFGVYTDVVSHLSNLERLLDDLENWLESTMQRNPTLDELNQSLDRWLIQQGRGQVTEEILPYFNFLNPSWMSASGLYRYWTKVKPNQND